MGPGMSSGAAAGLAFGVLFLGAFLGLVGVFVFKRYTNQPTSSYTKQQLTMEDGE